MMIADLIDEYDFRERLLAIGIAVPAAADPVACCKAALAAFVCNNASELPALIDRLMAQQGLLQPDVRTAIEQELLPHLRERH